MQLEFTAFGLTAEIVVRPFNWTYVRFGRFSSYASFRTGKDAPGIWSWRKEPGCFEVWAYWFYLVFNVEHKRAPDADQTDGLQGA